MKICGKLAKKDVGLLRNLRGFGHTRSVIPGSTPGLLSLSRHYQIVLYREHSRHAVCSQPGHVLI